MDVAYLAELWLIGWGVAFSTLGFVGFGKWIWNIIASSTEESVVEKATLKALEEKKKSENV